ncbi:ABC transporter permease [Desulfurobacterium atlanticum]|uniref:Lipoprotein-releasing system permease protein n=1 Tax=Desulfurobacterium atlanticum TaxID=240169 RepID=A0A238Z864_9BACT|nr:ABC transporter permease [Desulfurobacterium atlanticum]SNR79249.1 lipoprotein-releasing system permease protein [Desulfurobacterium atlanticum]
MNKLTKWFSIKGIKPRRGEGFLSFVFLIAILGVVVGVAALIIVNSVMTGFQSAIKDRLLSSNADIIVMDAGIEKSNLKEAEKKILKLPHVKGAELFSYTPVMVSAGENAFSSGNLRGCVPDREPKVTNIPRHLVAGSWDIFKKEKNGVVIGETLANTVGVTVGDRITLISPLGIKTPFGYIPRTGKFTVTGIFNVGMYQFDSALILAHIDTVEEVFGVKPAGIMVKLDSPDNVKLAEKEIRKAVGDSFIVNDWISMNKSLFSALKLEKLAMFLILTLIVIVASFNISSLLMMNVNHKSKDIAILKTLGAKDRFILKVFMTQGFLIGVIGTIIGEIIGIGISFLGEKYKLIALPPDVYYIDHLPFKLQLSDCIIAGVAAILISVLATIYPARKAAKTDPIKVLRAGEN